MNTTIRYLLTAACLTPCLLIRDSSAAVNYTGDVPQAGTGFGTITLDQDTDDIPDFIDDQGNNVFDFLADPDDPLGGTPDDPATTEIDESAGLAWDDPDIWVDYETEQHLAVGPKHEGSLVINGGSALRYQSVTIGGGNINTQAGISSEFEVTTTLGLKRAGGGVMQVSGFGSIFNNDPSLIAGEFVAALDEWERAPGTAINYNLWETPDPSKRLFKGWDIDVGINGRGILTVDSGGVVQCRDAISVGFGPYGDGLVRIDGTGSTLTCRGVTTGTSSAVKSATRASSIGTYGSGIMEVTAGGSAYFGNGLAVGGLIIDSFPSTFHPFGSGQLTITGAGSQVTVQAHVVTASKFNGYALVAGDFGTDHRIANTQGTGIIKVTDGGTLTVIPEPGGTESSPTQTFDANLGIGPQGELHLQNGAVRVQNRFENAGYVRGEGTITAAVWANHLGGRIEIPRESTLTMNATSNMTWNALGGADIGNGGIDFYLGNAGSMVIRGSLYATSNGQAVDGQSASLAIFRNFRSVQWSTDPTPVIDINLPGQVVFDGGTFESIAYQNHGVTAFVGGDNVVFGTFINAEPIDYDPDTENTLMLGGQVTVSGKGTSVTFVGEVSNRSTFVIGPAACTVVFAKGFTNTSTGTIQVSTLCPSPSAVLDVGEDVRLNGGTMHLDKIARADQQVGSEFVLVAAKRIEGKFDQIKLPKLEHGLTWEVDYRESELVAKIASDI